MHPYEFASAIKNRSLDLIFNRIELVTCGSQKVLFTGVGRAFVNDLGTLLCRFEANGDQSPFKSDYKMAAPGTLHSEDDFFVVRATEPTGDVWESKPTPRLPLGPFPFDAIRRIIPMRSLTRLKSDDDNCPDYAQLYFAHSMKLPLDRPTERVEIRGGITRPMGMSHDHHIRAIGGLHFEANLLPDGTSSIALQGNPRLASRAVDATEAALEFMVATDAIPCVTAMKLGERRTLTLRSGMLPRKTVHFGPPVPNGLTDASNWWSLFEHAFAFYERDSSISQTIRAYVRDTRSADHASSRVSCLALCTTIERLSETLEPKPVGEDLSSVEVDELRALIMASSVYVRFQKRISGSLSGLTRTQAIRRLECWSAEHGVPVALVKAWPNLRHRYAHGGEIDDDQRLADLYFANLELFYRMVAWNMKFSGKLMGYSTRGWPCIDVRN
jgi:hypothetical protein